MNKNYAYAYTSPSLIGTFNQDVKQGHLCQRFSDNEDNQSANSKLAEKGTVHITGSSLIFLSVGKRMGNQELKQF